MTYKKSAIQVGKEHYFKGYDKLERFISYFYQIDLVNKIKPKNILELGVGNKTVANYLKQNGMKIETCDFDKDLEPDHVADIRNLPFKNNSYDLVMACEVIEHIPWKDVDKALNELNRISKKYVLISIPYLSISFEFIFRFPLIRKIFEKGFVDIFFRIPCFFKAIKFKEHEEHHWEMGAKNHSKRKVKRILKKYFKIIKEVRPVLDGYHHFFILEKL